MKDYNNLNIFQKICIHLKYGVIMIDYECNPPEDE